MARRSLTQEAESLSDNQIKALGYTNRRDFYRNAYVTLPDGERVRIDHLPSDSKILKDYKSYLFNTKEFTSDITELGADLPLHKQYTQKFSSRIRSITGIAGGHTGSQREGDRRIIFTGETVKERNSNLRRFANYMWDMGYVDDFEYESADEFYQAYKETDE